MALRMNLYGWNFASFTAVLGSKDQTVFDRAMTLLANSLKQADTLANAEAWLRTLVYDGFPLRIQRATPAMATNGGLLTVQMEAEFHAVVVDCLRRALADPAHLNLAGESSIWARPMIDTLYRELAACRFTRTKSCPQAYFTWMEQLLHGSPLFGDDFCSDWSYYSLYPHEDLAAFTTVLEAASTFQRPVAPGLPEVIAKLQPTELSASTRDFVQHLVKWFRQLHAAKQDAFIIWW